jgi:hypothetical protein
MMILGVVVEKLSQNKVLDLGRSNHLDFGGKKVVKGIGKGERVRIHLLFGSQVKVAPLG